MENAVLKELYQLEFYKKNNDNYLDCKKFINNLTKKYNREFNLFCFCIQDEISSFEYEIELMEKFLNSIVHKKSRFSDL